MEHQEFTLTPVFCILGLFWFLSPVNTQRPSSIGTCPTETLGREFITSSMESCGSSGLFEVEITGYSAFTSVSVSVSNHTSHKIAVNQREIKRVQLWELVGINGSTKFNNTVVIKADKDISVVSVIHRQQSLETTVLYPVSSLGKEYYLVTPSPESSDSHPEFSVMTYKEQQYVTIQVNGKLHYLTRVYSTGEMIKIILKPFEGFHFKGITDLSGTRIVSDHPVAVLVTQMCSCNNTKCNHVFEQLQPTCSWGTTYIIPPLPRQDLNDTVYVMASQNTKVVYQLGAQQENVFLRNGSVHQFPVKLSSPVFISTNVSLQVLYYSRGPANTDHSHTFLMRVPDVSSYCWIYSLNNRKDFKNFALVVANTSESGVVIIDNQPVSGVKWNQVPGTGFSWGTYELDTDNRSYTVEHPSSSFGLLGVGVSDTKSYVIPGSCRKIVLPYECKPETLQIAGSLKNCPSILQGELNSSSSSPELCSFIKSTFVNLETTCAQNITVKEVAQQFNSLLDNSTLLHVDKSKSKEVASAVVTLLLQSVELASVTATLRSPGMTQNVTTGSLDIETRLVKGNCSPNEVFSLRAGQEIMDIHCKTVTRATLQDHQAVAFISYSNLTSFFNEGFLSKEDIEVDKELKNCHLNSRVVSGVVGGGRLRNLSERVNFTLRHEKPKKKEEMVFCVYWKFSAGKGIWTTEGCSVLHTDSDRTICSCDHLPSLALLMALTTAEECDQPTNSSIPSSCKNGLHYECNRETLQTAGSLETCKSFLQRGELNISSSRRKLWSFINSTIVNLQTIYTQNITVKEVAQQFSSLLGNSTLCVDESESKSKEIASTAVTLLLQSVELASVAAALRSPNMMQNVTTGSLDIETRLVKGNCSPNEVFSLRAGQEIMDIHCKTVTLATPQDHQAVAFISYSNLTSFFNEGFLSKEDIEVDKELKNCHLNSRVVSGVVGGDRLRNLSERVNFTLRHEKPKKEEDMVFCVYWKFTEGNGTWTTDGCNVSHTDSYRTNCSCNHLSSFAVLMSLNGTEESYPLTIITYMGLSISLLCLFLAILTFLLCRSIRNVSTSIHLQLCLCLFLANLLFLTTMDKPKDKKFPEVACAVIAGFLHYLFLACFTWMLLEGLHLFLTVRNLKVVNYTSASRFKKRYMYPFGYGFPALIVAISAGLNPDGYGTERSCWLKLQGGFLWSFLGPVCAIILINLTFFIVTLWILRSKLSSLNEGVSTIKDTRLLTFKAIAQLFVLGCTWSLGLFQFGSAKMVMAYLFTIVNSLQGAFIFLVHCLLNRQVRDEYRRWIKSTRKPSPTSHTSDMSMSANPYSTKMVVDSYDGVHQRVAWASGTAESSGLSVTS